MDVLKLSSFFSLRECLLDPRNGLSNRDKIAAEKMLLHLDSREKILEIALQHLISKHSLCRGDAGVCNRQGAYYIPCSSYTSVNAASALDQLHVAIPNFVEPQISVWNSPRPICFPKMRASPALPQHVVNLMTSIGTKSMTVAKIECIGHKIGILCVDSTHEDFIWSQTAIDDIHRFNEIVLSRVLWYGIQFSRALNSERHADFICQISSLEKEVLELLECDFTIKQIAQQLKLSEAAVRKRLKTCRDRFDIHSLVDLKAVYKRAMLEANLSHYQDRYGLV